MYRLGVVSFLNSRPLIAGLEDNHRFELMFEAPAILDGWLQEGLVDAALVPIVDVLHACGRYRVVSDACIGSESETMTVRVFSRTPPDRIRALSVDGDSHTSAALATVIWQRVYKRKLELRRIDARHENLTQCDSVLLIGDKVVQAMNLGFPYELDLGGAWRLHSGLPFVFAVWAYRADVERKKRAAFDAEELGQMLSAARDRGVAAAENLAQIYGPERGWPVELAERYLTKSLCFKLDGRCIEGANRFARYCAEADIVPAGAAIPWPSAVDAGGK